MPTPSTDRELSISDGQWLLAAARFAVARRLGVPATAPGPTPVALLRPAACFVTLTTEGQLRGCIGTLEPGEPLGAAVGHYAESAAFDDPRFPPLEEGEWPALMFEVSVLSPAQPLKAGSDAELLRQLQPRVHGLTIESGSRRATFLPQVWAHLPEPKDFLRQLKRKAGLSDQCSTANLRCSIYTVISYSD